MKNMFSGCSSITSIDVSGWDTSSVTNMYAMFSGCSSLSSLDLSGWDTSSVTDMGGMFMECSSLATLDVSGWDTSSVTGMGSLFSGCSSLSSLDLSGWDTSSVTNMDAMFRGCSSLASLGISGWDTSSVKYMGGISKYDNSGMFRDCTLLTFLDLSGWDTSRVTRMGHMFSGCSSLSSLGVSGWDTSSVTSMVAMFSGCSSLSSLGVSGWDTSSVTSMNAMFRGCSSLTSLDLSGWDTSSVTDMGGVNGSDNSGMFHGCSSLTSLGLSGWDTSSVEYMGDIFSGCSSLSSLDVSNWDTSAVRSSDRMYMECTSLSRWQVGQAYDIKGSSMVPPANSDSGWWSQNDQKWYTASEIYKNRSGIGDVYTSTETSASGQQDINISAAVIYINGVIASEKPIFKWTGSSIEPTITVKILKLDAPVVELVEGVDYTVSFANNVDVGTAEATITGIGTCTGSRTVSFKIVKEEGLPRRVSDYMIEEVGKYTSSLLYAQLDAISNSGCSYEEQLQRYNVLFSQNGITDVKEGIQYLSSTTSHRSAYSYLTTNEIYCSYNWYEWLYTTNKGLAARSLLYTSGLIFNYELMDYINFIEMSQGEFPGVNKCKEMLRQFMETDGSSATCDVLATASLTAEQLQNLVDLNKFVWDQKMLDLLDQIDALQEQMDQAPSHTIQRELDELVTEFAEECVKQIEADTSNSVYLNGKQFSEALGYAAPILEFAGATADDIVAIINLSRDIETYKSYSRFLDCIMEDREVSFEMRVAAHMLKDEIDNGYLKRVNSIVGDGLKLAGGMLFTDKSMMEAALVKAGVSEAASSTLSAALATVSLATFIDNIIIDTGDFVKQAAYTEAYAELGASFAYRLEQDKRAFLDVRSAENAWTFFEDYTLLWKLRYKGEEQYLDMNKVKALIFVEVKLSDYSLKEGVVKDTLDHLETIRFDVPSQYTIPDSVQYAQKAVVHCPVDVEVRAADGSLIALLRDGEESDVSNANGRFVVVRDSYSGDYVKVACLSSGEDVTIGAVAVDDGNVSIRYASTEDPIVRAMDNVPLEEGDAILVDTGEISGDGGYSIDRNGDGSVDQVGSVSSVTSDGVAVSEVTLSSDALDIGKGEATVFEVSVSPGDASNKSVAWAVADDSVATVVDGKVTGVAEGQTTVSCTSLSNPDARAECAITVLPAINKTDVSKATVDPIPDQPYTGKPVTPEPTVRMGQTVLRSGLDYRVSYRNNVEVGTATLIVAGRGHYTGTLPVKFDIVSTVGPEPSTLCYGVDNARLDASMVNPGSDFTLWESTDGKTALLGGYHGSSSVVVVPSAIDGQKVVGLESGCFEGDTAIREVYLPDTVTDIVELAFSGCSSLESVNLGSIKKDLSRRRFNGILRGCTSLKRLTMSDEASFPITLSDGTGNYLNIMDGAVVNSLEYIYLGSSMNNTVINLFYGDSLKWVDVGVGNSQYSSVDGVVYSADGKVLQVMGSAYEGEYKIPDGCEEIGSYAFQNCAGLTNVYIPTSVTAIGSFSFDDASPTITTPRGSYASEYAKEKGLKVVYADGPLKEQVITAKDVSVAVGETVSIGASTSGDGRLSYKSFNTGVATVDESGRVRGVSVGTAKVTITASETETYSYATRSVTVKVTAATSTGAKWERLAGDGRYDTMAAIVQAGFAKSEWAVVATGKEFPDALVAASLAGAKGCPVVLTAPTGLSKQARSELERLGVRNAYVMGGTGAVDDKVMSALGDMGIAAERVAGSSRMGTSLETLKEIDELGGFDGTVVVATGYNFADALSIGPWCYRTATPMLLTNKSGRLSDAQASYCKGKVKKAIIVGGDAAVSEEVVTQLGLKASDAKRLAGSTRFATSKMIAEWETGEQGMTMAKVAVATGDNFPDALAGAALCGTNASPLLLVRNEKSVTLGLVNKGAGIHTGYVLGGEGAVSASVMSKLESLTM